MVYANIVRENDVTAVDTKTALTERGSLSPGNVVVPQATLLTGIKISVAPDWTADAHYGYSSAIQLSGSGVGGHQCYPGPCGFTTGVATGSSGVSVMNPQRYKTRIPVQPGQGIAISGYMHGEDCGSLRMAVGLEFDGVPGMIKDMDYREENLAAANTPVTLGAKLGAADAYIEPASLQIGEIHVNGGLKAVAGPLASVAEFEIYGGGIPKGGDYQFIGHGFATQDDIGQTTAGTDSGQTVSEVYQIPPGKFILSSGAKFQAQAQMIEDDVGTIYAIIGIGYL